MVAKKPEPVKDVWLVDDEGNKVGHPEYSPGVSVITDRDRLTITLKAGSGYDAPWLVYHAASVEEGIDFLTHDRYDELADLTARKGKELAKAFGGVPAAAKPASSGGWSSKPQGGVTQLSTTSSDVPSGTCPVHNCDLVYVEPFKKRDGSEISARVACPVPKCYAKTFWHNKDGSWTEK